MDLLHDYHHGSELDAGRELSFVKETNPMQMKQKYWKMTNRSQDSKEAAVILPKRNMKISRGGMLSGLSLSKAAPILPTSNHKSESQPRNRSKGLYFNN